jgi:hypothetical protein
MLIPGLVVSCGSLLPFYRGTEKTQTKASMQFTLLDHPQPPTLLQVNTIKQKEAKDLNPPPPTTNPTLIISCPG